MACRVCGSTETYVRRERRKGPLGPVHVYRRCRPCKLKANQAWQQRNREDQNWKRKLRSAGVKP